MDAINSEILRQFEQQVLCINDARCRGCPPGQVRQPAVEPEWADKAA